MFLRNAFIALAFLFALLPGREAQAQAYYGPNYHLVDNYNTTGWFPTIEAAIADWWPKYQKRWAYAFPGCSYYTTYSNPTAANKGEVARVHLQGTCGGSGPILATAVTYNPERSVGEPGAEDGAGDNMCGNPINVGVGNKFQAESDFAGDGLLQFERYYNSLETMQTLQLGLNWSHTFVRRIDTLSSTKVKVLRPDGERLTFNLSSGVWTPETDVTARLTRLTNASGVLTGWTFVSSEGSLTESFDALGRVVAIANRSLQSVTLVYNGGVIENNADDRLVTRVTDEKGRYLSFEYDPTRRITKMVDPAGAQTLYGYDSAGRLATVTYPGPAIRTYLYNEPAHTQNANLPAALTGIIDEANRRYATFGYNAAGQAISTEHGTAGAQCYSTAYNADGSTTIAMPSGAVQTRTFATFNGIRRPATLTTVADGRTLVKSYTYDANGRLDVVTDRGEVKTDHDYDAVGLLARLVAAKDTPGQQTTTITWDAAHRRATTINRAGQRRELTLNTRGQVTQVKVTDLASGTFRRHIIGYCEQAQVDSGSCAGVGPLRTINGPRADVSDATNFSYRIADHASCATNPTGCPYRRGDLWKVNAGAGEAYSQITEILAYDGAGRTISMKDPNGIVTDLEYSPRGWLLASKRRGVDATSEADDTILRFEYDAAGLVTKATEPDGTYVRFNYDDAHRLTDVTDALGNVVRYSLDAAGLRTETQTLQGGTVLKRKLGRVYNQLGKLAQLKDASDRATLYTYDASGSMDLASDPLNRTLDRDVDALGRLERTIRDVGGIAAETRFEHDARDNLTRVVDPGNLQTTYARNGFDEVTRLTSPDTGITDYGYDVAGQLVSRTDARGVAINYAYDALGRLLSIDVPTAGQDAAFTYDTPPADCGASEQFGKGRLASMTDESGSTRYCYDRHGNLVRKVQAITQGTTLTLGATYDGAGNVVAMTYPSGAIVTYVRNANGQVTRVDAKPTASAPQATLVSSLTYLPFGPITSIVFGNGRTQTRSYDQDYGIDALDDGAADGLRLDYTLDAVGKVTAVTERASLSRSYEYDGLDRLQAMKSGSANLESFSYDATGNRRSKTIGASTAAYNYDPNSHRLVQVVGQGTRSYDAAGNTVTIGSYALPHDDQGRLREFRVGAVHHQSYVYNGKGERVLRIGVQNPAITYQFVYDESGHLIGEYSATGGRIAEYVWVGDLLVGVLKPHQTSTYQYVETDALGTPRAVINPVTNTTIWRWDLTQTAFGDHSINNDPDGNGAAFNFNLRFPGQYYNGLDFISYNYYRDYDARTGRYVQSDRIGLGGGISTYAYANSNPLGIIDPLGLVGTACQKGNAVGLALPISFNGATEDQINAMVKAIEERWTGRFGKYQVKMDVIVLPASTSTPGTAQNRVFLYSGGGQSYVSPGSLHTGYWYWPGQYSARQLYSHEAGHFFGLLDDDETGHMTQDDKKFETMSPNQENIDKMLNPDNDYTIKDCGDPDKGCED